MLARLGPWALVILCLPAAALAQAQPDWTRARFFQGGQIYVIPPESVRLEYNLRDELNLDGTGITGIHANVGGWATLPMRWQIGVLLGTVQDGLLAPLVLEHEVITLAWAWAPWGRLWGNPVISASFMRGTHAAPEGGLRLTVGDAIWGNWRAYGALQFSRELSGFALQDMYQVRAGLAWQSDNYPITWSMDAGFGLQDQAQKRFSASMYEFWATPGFAWEPWRRMYLMAVLGWTVTTDRDNGTSTSSWTATPEGFVGYHFE